MKSRGTVIFGVLTAISLFVSIPAAQAFERIRLQSVHGNIEAHGALQLTSLEPYLLCHYCKVSTCAGGPRSVKVLELKDTAGLPGQAVSFESKPGTLFSLRPMARLSSCSVVLSVKGIDDVTGEAVSGRVILAHSKATDQEKFWESKHLTEKIQEKLDRGPIQLEIQQFGIARPEIGLVPGSEVFP
ncbi:MAG TPA: hypothetical protein VJB59_03795 [Bdellovibrionota bacterium]|nr:hypothetical protein [Bdellovibrionota bacterium]